MMKISDDDVRNLATLSAISLSDDEVLALRTDLENIISYIDQLAELDTTGVEPTYQVHSYGDRWREDEVEQSVAADTLLGLAKQSTNSSINVPKVL
jgi:aspartyl-tRNA(Asn)/glutamyl-tRNA(Gln) amidotransferase subunit C